MEDVITLDYGSGGQKTAELIDSLLVPAFSNPALNDLGDGAVLEGNGQLVFSTDSFVVSPWKFPGGNIGRLCVCGTVNDLCMAGGLPKYLSLSLILEEGFPLSCLQEIVASISEEAARTGQAFGYAAMVILQLVAYQVGSRAVTVGISLITLARFFVIQREEYVAGGKVVDVAGAQGGLSFGVQDGIATGRRTVVRKRLYGVIIGGLFWIERPSL